MKSAVLFIFVAIALVSPREAAAQLDPLLFLKNKQPNVILMVDTGNRMQRDTNDDYRDANIYKRLGGTSAAWEVALGITDANTSAAGVGTYRRKYVGLTHQDPASSGGDRFTADHIETVGNLDGAYSTFEEATRIAMMKRGLIEAVTRNSSVARFGLMRTRQLNPRFETPASAGAVSWKINSGPVRTTNTDLAWVAQTTTTDDAGNKWKITRPIVDANNGAVGGPVGPLVAADAANANTTVLNTLALATGAAGSLIPDGNDARNVVDTPVDLMLTDAKTEATRLITTDTQCRNTVLVLVVGGGRGNTSSGDVKTLASGFVNVSLGHRVPIYVIAIAPPAADVADLQAIATNSGGTYTEITAAMANAPTAGQPIPEFVRAVNSAVQHSFVAQSDCDAALTTENQVTSPVVGTANLVNAKDITGIPLPLTDIINAKTGAKIPQRSNVMITTGFSLPGFEAKLRAFRVYKPVADATKSSGYKFVSDGTRLWVGCAPGTTTTAPCNALSADSRNIYTALPDGTVIAFSTANAVTLRQYLFPNNPMSVAAAQSLISFIRSQPLGAILGSTPAIMDPPSLDPPPDSDYPGFADANKNRRAMIWVGANDGMLHGIDARLGIETWAFIPFNLLPKLDALRSGQPVGDFRYFVDGSPKVADVKIVGAWRTYLIMGEGAGGTFYQAFDVTLPNMEATAPATSDVITQALNYFAVSSNVQLKWAFPRYSQFDYTISTASTPWGDISSGATAAEKAVGETWSDPAVGEIQSSTGRYAVLTGSGFLKYSIEQQANRNGTVAGTTFYLLDAKDGTVLDSRSVGSDGQAETGVAGDSCVAADDCRKLKNALQADPVATGPPDSRFITKAYIGDLDGRLWRFDISLDGALVPKIPAAATKLYDAGAAHPMFSSMATVTVGGTQQYLFQGTGSDMLPSNSVSQSYKLLVILDNGGSGSKTAEIALTSTDGAGTDEKVTAFPAVAGDIVFFATTNFKPGAGCTAPDANLYAFTFVGGAAYDTNGSGSVTGADSTKVRTATGSRASAPFVVDQHLVFATGNKVEMFGDPEDYNNGVGQAGVRILSWREVR